MKKIHFLNLLLAWFGIVVLPANSQAILFKLPDTGQTQSYTNTFGEDSDYTINPPSFTENGDGTVTDNNTGLMWQQNDDGNTYNWYQATGTDDSVYNPGAAVDVCGDFSVGGHADWRLPSKKELIGIVDYGSYAPAIDTSVFTNTKSANYWSSTPYKVWAGHAWHVSFIDGMFDYYDDSVPSKSNNHYVRCVRGESTEQSFTANDDGTVTDNTTGLIWEQEPDSSSRTWEEGLGYCENLELAGQTDWRLPNARELESITDESQSMPPAIDTTVFPFTLASGYWTSTTYISYGGGSGSYCVDFTNGGIGWCIKEYLNIGLGPARCVRGGIINDSDNDGITDNVDNCPHDSNADQADADGDQIGDMCDTYNNYDFNGDGKSDILLHNSTNGLIWRFKMNGSSIVASNSVAQLDSAWQLAGLADLNGDWKSDIVLRHSSGLTHLFQMEDNVISMSASITTLNNEVAMAGLGDFNGDSKADVLLRNTATGELSILIMDGNTVQQTISLITMALDWEVAAVGDFGGDNYADILLRKSNGLLWLLQVNGSSVAHSNGIAQLNSNWQVAAGADYNGDGKTDILLHNSSNGLFWLYQMNGYSIENSRGIAVLNTVWQVAAAGDYNGDGTSDILLRNPNTGLIWLWQMNGHSIVNSRGVALINPAWAVVQ